MEERKYFTKRSEFKGNAMLVITSGDNDRFPFQFGLGKAKRIIACIDDIKKFVDEGVAAESSKVKVQ